MAETSTVRVKTYRPAEVRFYLDADILGLARLLVQVRNDVTYPGDPGGVLHMVTLHGPEARGPWQQLEIFMCRWRDIEGRVEQPGPFIYTATRTTFRPIEL